MTEEPVSAEDFTLDLVPNNDDMRCAGAWLAAQRTLEVHDMMVQFWEAEELGRLFQLCTAFGEILTRQFHLREDPEAIVLLRQQIAAYALQCP